MSEADSKSIKERLILLIKGYKGYHHPKARMQSSDIFEKFLYDKTALIQNFLEKKYDEFVLKSNFHQLLFPLSEIIKLFAECKKNLNYSRNKLHYFFEELRFSSETEDNLCELDFAILRNISVIVDKISGFHLVSDEYLDDLANHVKRLDENLIKRFQLIHQYNQELKQVFDELEASLREINNKKATRETYQALNDFIDRYPNRYLSYKEILQCYRNNSAQYLNIQDNIPILSIFEDALLFLENYELFIKRLSEFLQQNDPTAEEEKECHEYMKSRVPMVPDFSRERNLILSGQRAAAEKVHQRKSVESVLKKATIMYEIGLEFEKRMDYIGAFEFFCASFNFDQRFIEARQGIIRCEARKNLMNEFQKANKLLIGGHLEKAKKLYQQLFAKHPEVPVIDEMIKRVENLEKEG